VQTGLGVDELGELIGTPIRTTDLDFGISAAEQDSALRRAPAR
jgi:hypothetical protein